MVTDVHSASTKTSRRARVSPASTDLIDPATLLRSAGLRATGPRLALLHALQDRQHATVEELAGDVAGDAVVLSTVYRTLDHLERIGVVRQVNLTPDRRTYHLAAAADHIHLRCTECEDLSEVGADLLGHFAGKIKAATGFALDTRHPVLTGICARCQQR